MKNLILKRALSLFLIFVLIITFSSCGKKNNSSTPIGSENTVSTETQEEFLEELPEEEFVQEPIVSKEDYSDIESEIIGDTSNEDDIIDDIIIKDNKEEKEENKKPSNKKEEKGKEDIKEEVETEKEENKKPSNKKEEKGKEDIKEEVETEKEETENPENKKEETENPENEKEETENPKNENEKQPTTDGGDKEDKNNQIYTGKDYGGKEITKGNLDFGGKTVTIVREWAPFTKGNSAKGDRFLAAVEELEKKYNVNIEEKQQKVNLAAEMLSGATPSGHLYLISSENCGNIFEMANKGYLADFNDAMKKTGIDMTAAHYSKANTQLANLNGKQWAIGVGIPNVKSAILYNKKLIQNAGFDVNELISSKQWTWSKFTEIAQKTTLRDVSGEVTQWGIGMNPEGVKALVLSNVGKLVYTDENGKFVSGLKKENTVEALQQAYNWYNVDRVATTFSGGAWSSGNTAFSSGKVALYFADSSAFSHAYSNLKAEDYGIAYLPLGPKAQNYVSYVDDCNSYVVPSVYQNITTELLLLVDELYKYSETYTSQDHFKNEWFASFHTNTQYNMWYNMYYSTDVKRVWEGLDKVNLGGSTANSIESLIGGTFSVTAWVEANDAIYSANSEIFAEVYKYTGNLK